MTLMCGPTRQWQKSGLATAHLRKAGATLSFRVPNPVWREELACHISKSGKCVNDCS
jgi:hypothetical protein